MDPEPTLLRFFAILSFVAVLFAGAAKADDKPLVVVELFTSQGCSSCPPADAMIEELATRADVLPLALHVDYWDYIGWADSFARPEHTYRQKAYAHMAHDSSIYTPQIMVGGTDAVVGYKPMRVANLLARDGAMPVAVLLRVERDGSTLRIRCAARAGTPLPDDINVDLVGYTGAASVDIRHGENAGKTITYANIVRSWDRVGEWDGTGSFDTTAQLGDDEHYAVIVQVHGPGKVLAAARVD